ncbi:ankyrin repeat domain-containing protein [candidate division KSB1 bacterium]
MKNIYTFCSVILLILSFTFPVTAQDIHEAAKNGELQVVKDLIENDPKIIDSPDKSGYTPLIRAAIEGHLEIVRYLVEKGANIEAKERYQMTPLFWAINRKHSDIAEYLIGKGADIEARNIYRSIPLVAASENNLTEVVELLIEKGADVNAGGLMGMPIHRAAFRGNAEIVGVLADNGADIEAITRSMTPMHLACNAGRPEVVRVLLEKGADPDVLGVFIAPLEWALRCGSPGAEECAEILIESGANVNLGSLLGDTPLSEAVKNGYSKTAKLLIEKGADSGMIDRDHYRTMLHYAAIKGYADVAQELIKSGIDLNAKDIYGYTALYYAGKHGNKDVADILTSAETVPGKMEENYGKSEFLSKKLKNDEAYIWYMDNRGWTIKTNEGLFVFDNEEKGRKPDSPKLSNGWISGPEIADQKIFSIYSCYHADPNTLEFIHGIEDELNDITYIHFTGDRWRGNRNTVYFDKQDTEIFGDVEINSARMSDNSWTLDYLIKAGDLTFFYPGFYHNDLESFKKEIDYFAEKGDKIDFAFLFITPGQKNEYAEYLVEKLNPKAIFPMDPNRRELQYREMAHKIQMKYPDIEFGCAENSGDRFHFKGGKIK